MTHLHGDARMRALDEARQWATARNPDPRPEPWLTYAPRDPGADATRAAAEDGCRRLLRAQLVTGAHWLHGDALHKAITYAGLAATSTRG